jgi:hypothetical protein
MRLIHHIVFATLFLFVATLVPVAARAQSDAAQLDERILKDTDREFGGVYRDMGVVQRKAMDKGGRFLFSLFGSLDLSDLPWSNLGANADIGYAISDFLEVYVHWAPLFMNQERNYAKQLENYECSAAAIADGFCESGDSPQAELQRFIRGYGATIVWAPSYGKDSIGSSTILRSDTFFKFSYQRSTFQAKSSISTTQYGANTYALGVGKTFFFGKHIGARAVVNAIYTGVPNFDGVVKNFFIGGVEFGTVLYW